jgi:putative SOS response-associated peptidase YedK
MCGRYTLIHSLPDIASTLQVRVSPSLQTGARYNVAPTQNVATVLHDDDGDQLELLRWGLIPSWAKDESIGSRMINARAETLAEKPSFKRLLRSRRCLIVADGFYEWAQEANSKTKTPMYITMKDQDLFTFAGLWDSWRDPQGQQIMTCTIITTQPNAVVAPIHNRMPAILTPDARKQWLDPTTQDDHRLLHLLAPYQAEEMVARPVSRLVNDPKRDDAALIA